jgi:hypothetical protein
LEERQLSTPFAHVASGFVDPHQCSVRRFREAQGGQPKGVPMSKPAPTLGLMAIAEHFFTGLRAWWQHRNELGSIDSNEFKRIAGEVGIHSASSVDGRTRTAARKTNMACGLQKI